MFLTNPATVDAHAKKCETNQLQIKTGTCRHFRHAKGLVDNTMFPVEA